MCLWIFPLYYFPSLLCPSRGVYIYIYIYIYWYNLREFVLTHVILAPGACGREAPSRGSWHLIIGIAGKSGSGDEFQIVHISCACRHKCARCRSRVMFFWLLKDSLARNIYFWDICWENGLPRSSRKVGFRLRRPFESRKVDERPCNPFGKPWLSTLKTPRKVKDSSNARATLLANREGRRSKRLVKLKTHQMPVQPFR